MLAIRHPPSAIRLSRYWLFLGIAALAVAGVFSLVLVVARTPALSDIALFNALFHTSLAVHVDLSVLVWFLAIACLMWSMLAAGAPVLFPFVEEAALISFALGTLAIALSPLDGKAQALMSNYIPVITNPLFFAGLSLVLCGVILMLVRVLSSRWSDAFTPLLQYAVFVGGLIAVIAIGAFFWSYAQLRHDTDPVEYFELLFWGGGHTLQYLHGQMVMVCWLLLITALHPGYRINMLLGKFIFAIGFVAALAVPFAYMHYDVNSVDHRNFFTLSMIMAGGTAQIFLAILLTKRLWLTRCRSALWSALFMSMLLFFLRWSIG